MTPRRLRVGFVDFPYGGVGAAAIMHPDITDWLLRATIAAKNDQRIEEVAIEIGRYLHAHPDAADSAEGVRHWWLTEGSAKVALAIVYAALDKLVSQGAVKMRVLADGTRIYSGRIGGSM